VNPRKEAPPRRLAEREGESKLTAANVNPPFSGSKTFDPVEKKLSLALDSRLDVIEIYRDAKR